MSNQTTAVSIRDDQTVFDDRQIAMLRNMGVEKAQPADLALFFHVSKRTGLDPFARQIYMIERWTKNGPKQTIQTGIDGFRLIARRAADRTGERISYEDTQWCGPDGQWTDVWVSSEPPAAARVTVLRGGERFPGIALFEEYKQTTKSGDLTQMWRDKSAGQLAKCAEALALRKAFPQDLSGIYTDDEMQQADTPQASKPSRHTATRQAPAISAADFGMPATTDEEPAVDTATGEVIEEQA